LMAFRRSLWFPSVVSALLNHRFIACALAAILVCKVIPSHSVSGPARYLDARAVRWCRGFYRAYRSETVRQLNARGKGGEQSVVLPAAQDPGHGIHAQQVGGRLERNREVLQRCRVQVEDGVAG